MPYTKDPLKGLSDPMKSLINLFVEQLAPYFTPEKREEAVCELKERVAFIVRMEGYRQQGIQRHVVQDERFRSLLYGMGVSSQTIGEYLEKIAKTKNPEELQQYLFEYAELLKNTQNSMQKA